MASVFGIPFSSSDHDHDHDHDFNPESSPPPLSTPPAACNEVKGKVPIGEKEKIKQAKTQPKVVSTTTTTTVLSAIKFCKSSLSAAKSSRSPVSIPSSSSCPELSTELPSLKLDHQSRKSANNISPPHELSRSQTQEPRPANQTPPVIQTIIEQDLGRHILVLAVPMALGLFVIYNLVRAPLITRIIAVALSLGFVLIWNGLLLRPICAETSNLIEPIGISFMLLALFEIIACFLPQNLIWFPIICWVLSHIPFAVSFFRKKRAKRSTSDNKSTTLRPPV